MLDEVLNQIGQRQTFILTSHARPDGDAVGSALACCQILRSMGKQASVVLSGGVPVIYRPLPYSETVLRATEQAPEAEAAIILECDSVQRTCLTGLDRHYLINIDHHSTAKPFADVNWIDPSACATAEMIFLLACRAGVKNLAGDRHLPIHRGAGGYRHVLLPRHHGTHLCAGAGAGTLWRGPRAHCA